MTALLLFAACSGVPRGDIHFNVRPHKDDARISIQVEGERALLDIFSASGIGSADLEITSPNRPRQILLRFHLSGLEELRFAYQDTVITASLSSTKEQSIRQSFSKTGPPSAAAEAITSGHALWMKIRIVPGEGMPPKLPLPQGYIEVEAPASFIAGDHRRVTIHWIDFYR